MVITTMGGLGVAFLRFSNGGRSRKSKYASSNLAQLCLQISDLIEKERILFSRIASGQWKAQAVLPRFYEFFQVFERIGIMEESYKAWLKLYVVDTGIVTI